MLGCARIHASDLFSRCQWTAADEACALHSMDSVIFCSAGDGAAIPEGSVRLLSFDGAPSVDGKGR